MIIYLFDDHDYCLLYYFFLERVVICLTFLWEFTVNFDLLQKKDAKWARRLPCFPLSFYLLCQLTIINSTFHIYSVVHFK